MQRTDDEEYGEFVEARYDALRRFGYLLCGDWHLTEDVVAAALTKLYLRWPRLIRGGNADAYVRRIVVTCLADERRRGFARRERPSERTPTGSSPTTRRAPPTGSPPSRPSPASRHGSAPRSCCGTGRTSPSSRPPDCSAARPAP